MTADNEQTIEVEVVEINGVAVEQSPDRGGMPNAHGRNDLFSWLLRVKHLGALWWPLLLVLSIVVLTLAVAIAIGVAASFLELIRK